MYRSTGERERKLYHILITGLVKDSTGHSVFKPSRIANHLAAYYVGTDFYLWNHSPKKQRKEIIDKFYERHGRIGINRKDNPVYNPGDALRELKETYSSWDIGHLGKAYRNVKEFADRKSTKESCKPENISNSQGQYFLSF